MEPIAREAIYGMRPLLHEHQSFNGEALDFNHLPDGSIELVRYRVGNSWQPVFFTQRTVGATDECVVEFTYNNLLDGNCFVGFATPGVNRSTNTWLGEQDAFMFRPHDMAVWRNHIQVKSFRRPADFAKGGPRKYALLLNMPKKTLTLFQ